MVKLIFTSIFKTYLKLKYSNYCKMGNFIFVSKIIKIATLFLLNLTTIIMLKIDMFNVTVNYIIKQICTIKIYL